MTTEINSPHSLPHLHGVPQQLLQTAVFARQPLVLRRQARLLRQQRLQLAPHLQASMRGLILDTRIAIAFQRQPSHVDSRSAGL